MTTDPVKLAERLARQAIPAQTALVSDLVAAVAALDAVRGLSVATKQARAVVGPALNAEIEHVAQAMTSLESAARRRLKQAREAALNGGWSLGALREIGALAPAVKRSRRGSGERDRSHDPRSVDGENLLADSELNGEISPIREELQ